MKKFLISTVLLLSSFYNNLIACGYSPYGEDVRYSLYNPALFNFGSYHVFNYNSDMWSYDYYPNTNFESNVFDWYNYTNKKVSLENINFFLNNSSLSDLHSENKNEFIQYLYKKKDFKALSYLKLAKRCENSNTSITENAWELENFEQKTLNLKIFQDLLKAIQNEKSNYFKRKYVFQAIRMSFYNMDMNSIKSLFEKHFLNTNKDYLYYWSLYFYCFTNPIEKDTYITEIFANSKEKNYATYYYFHNEFNSTNALLHAKNNIDKANVYVYLSLQKTNKNLEYLKKIYQYNSTNKILDHLLVREINKIEDWIYTPYYTYYSPTVYYQNTSEEFQNETIETLSKRVISDRLYAKEVLDFINSININNTYNPEIWYSAKIQLQFMSQSYNECLHEIENFNKSYSKNKKLLEQIEKIKALCLFANQNYGKAKIPKETETIILKYQNDAHFIFALGRELEYKGNLKDGIALISLLENNGIHGAEYYSDENIDVEWLGNRLKNSGNLPVFYTYFDYLDFVYSAKELKQITDELNLNFTSEFKRIIYNKLLKDKNYLKDLLGTKYLRENNLQESLNVYKTINQKYWDDNFNGWEKDIYSDYTFDQNPFYSFKHTKEFIPHLKKFIVNKKTVVENLINFIKKSENPNTKDRAYYAFIVANCYYNMGQNGNSWMMRRTYSSYWRTDENFSESYIDENEYRRNELAIHYYNKAMEYSKKAKFKALCIRMIDFVKSQNGINSKLLKINYPEYESDLSSCDNLEYYFNSKN